MGIGTPGWGEILLIFFVVLLLFGTKRLPEVGKSLGKAIREFKKAGKEIQEELNVDLDEEELKTGRSGGYGEKRAGEQVGQG